MKADPVTACVESMFFRIAAALGPADWDGAGAALAGLDGAQWRALMALAARHGMLGLFARNLGWAHESTGFKAPVLDALVHQRRGQLIQHLTRKAAATRVAGALAGQGIALAFIKGIVLAEEVYGDLSLRGFGDIDFLVPKNRVLETHEVLHSLGYRTHSFSHFRDYLTLGVHSAPLVHEDGSGLDLHWSIDPDFQRPGDLELIWQHCVAAPQGAFLPGLRLSPELTLIHLAKHFHTHQYLDLKPLVDFYIASLALEKKVDPDVLTALARALDALPIVEIAAALCERHLRATPLTRQLAGRSAPRRTALACRVLSKDALLRTDEKARVVNFTRFLLAAGTRRSTLKSLLRSAVPDKHELERRFAQPYTRAMYPRFYARQFIRLVSRSRQAG